MIIAKENEREIFFEKNIKLLPPYIQNTVLKVDKEKLWEKVEVRYNEKGYPVCWYHDNGNSFKITSEKPIQEAKGWYDEIEKRVQVLFLYGTGFGYSLLKYYLESSLIHWFWYLKKIFIFFGNALLF